MEVYLGAGTPKLCKKLSLKYLLISEKTRVLAQAVQNNLFLGVHLERFRRSVPNTMSKFVSLNYLLMLKKIGALV